LWHALACLGQQVPDEPPLLTCREVLAWGVANWKPQNIHAHPIVILP
jgi:hypothetical protein